MKEKVVLDEQKRKIQESLKGLTTDLQNERDSVQADLNKLMKNVHETEGAVSNNKIILIRSILSK